MTICKRPPHPFDANAAPTPLNPSIVLSEESEIQSPRFPVLLSENIVPAAFLPNAGLLRDPGCSSPFGQKIFLQKNS
ncbi:hypothetical protein N7449_001865 [Penicillium cf. viridicatum]|uniref:Uncharacterized protein n=1 Tax=Penicillium cf. viridicatum TaxID=2972119 RepID=A0A9W9N7M0_9EURO|nr:hypothetical protein N7449_001865 [Penicillium cf. viridicatum]